VTDLELNRKLALAIGWREDQMEVLGDFLYVEVVDDGYREFDHADWRVAGPIAKKFDCFPFYMAGLWWVGGTLGNPIKADTPQRAIAMAATQGAGK